MRIITQILDRLKELLPESSWKVTGANRTIRAEYLPASKAIATAAGIDVVAQFWLLSPPKWLTFEIANEGDQKALREQVADDFRRYLVERGIPEFVVLSRGSTICRLRVGSGDHEAPCGLSELDTFVVLLRDQVTAWTATKAAGALK